MLMKKIYCQRTTYPMHKMQQQNKAIKADTICQQADPGMKLEPGFVRHAIIASMTLAIVACGDSDLPALQRDAIIEAQQRFAAAQQASQADQSAQENSEVANPAVTQTPAASENSATTETDDADPATEQSVQPGAATAAPSEPPNTLNFDDFQLVFNENFDDGVIDPEKWTTAFRWGPDLVVNNEEQYYVDIQNTPDFGYNPFRMDSGSLAIGANLTPDNLLADANDQTYLSGVLTTADRFEFTHGIAEIRALVPAGAGLLSQFWMLPDVFEGLRPQTFIMEVRGNEPEAVFHSYKYQDENDVVQTSGALRSEGTDFSADFHTYAVEWSPDELIYYIDGVEFQRFTSENIASQDMYLILTLAIGGVFPGSPDDTTVFPAELIIDHVRVFQQIPQ